MKSLIKVHNAKAVSVELTRYGKRSEKDILKEFRNEIHGIIHNTGGGQTKILKFGKGIKFTKNNLFEIPKIFELIQRSSETQWKEMFSVFNMGHRMELCCNESIALEILNIIKKYKIDSKIIGYCEKSSIAARLPVDSPWPGKSKAATAKPDSIRNLIRCFSCTQ